MKTDRELLEIYQRYVELAKDETMDEKAKKEARLKIGPDLTWDDMQRLMELSAQQRELAEKKHAELERMLRW